MVKLEVKTMLNYYGKLSGYNTVNGPKTTGI